VDGEIKFKTETLFGEDNELFLEYEEIKNYKYQEYYRKLISACACWEWKKEADSCSIDQACDDDHEDERYIIANEQIELWEEWGNETTNTTK
jgi:hypothetical protein